MSYPTYNIAVLDIFLKAMGEGFPARVLCFDGFHRTEGWYGILYGRNDMKGIGLSNFKQKVRKMKKGDIKCAREIKRLLLDGLERLVNGKIIDSLAAYSHEEASDKYANFYYGLRFPYSYLESFFYEEDEAVLAYLITRWLVEGCEKEGVVDCDIADFELRLMSEKEKKEQNSWRKMAFRSEYYSALWDVVENGEGNKTFYKWPIDELYKGCDKGCDKEKKEKIDEIMRQVFGDTDGNISTTFGKLKDESGVRRWTTFDKLFQNELNDEKLKALLQDDNLLEKYQVFQSRMINAFVLENLRAILPKKIGGDLASEVFESLFRHVKGEPVDLESAFPVPEHDGKVTEYEE